jgi:membrane-associated phospholipid phosphatase
MDATMKKIYLTLILTILSGCSLFAQNPVIQNPVPSLKYDFPQFGRETVDFIKSPGKWDGGDWLKVGLIGAGTVLLIETADKPVRNAVLKDQRYYYSAPIVMGRVYGELYSPVVFFGGYAIYSLIADDIGTRKIAYEIGQASIYAGVINYVLKVAIGRARPYLNDGPTEFHPFSSLFSEDYHSNPSGHSTVAFVISTVLSRNAKPVWLKVLAYLPAALTLVSRVYQDQHWTSDDFLGAAFGYFIASWVVDQHEKNQSTLGISPTLPLSIRIALN